MPTKSKEKELYQQGGGYPMDKLDQQTADQLILSVAQGDMKALETLYNAMYREIYGYLLSLLGNEQTAEDLAQDTFLRVYKYAPKFVPAGSGKSWVYKIAGRLALTYFKNNRDGSTALSEYLSGEVNAEEDVLNAQLVAEAMQKISEEERQIISLHAISGLTLGEIADILNKPLGTIKWKHAEAIKKLRKLLEEHF